MKIHITNKTKGTIDKLIDEFPSKEFTLFGKTRVEGDEVHLIDIRVPNQTSTGGDTEVDEDEISQFLNELIDAGEDPRDWNMWIHSHHSMGAFWSGTDTTQMDSFDIGGPEFFFHVTQWVCPQNF